MKMFNVQQQLTHMSVPNFKANSSKASEPKHYHYLFSKHKFTANTPTGIKSSVEY